MTVLEDIARMQAELVRIVPQPVAPLGYGRDLSCITDVTDNMDEVDPFTMHAISEAMCRRFSTPRGQLQDDKNYGLDLRSYCNRGTPVAELRDLAGQVQSEATKDDRVDSCTAVVTFGDPAGTQMSVKLQITPVDARLGTFSHTLAVTSGEVQLEAYAP